MTEEWLTTAEAAELSGYHPERIRELVRAGKIYGRKFGTVWQIAEPSLLVFLEEVCQKELQGQSGRRYTMSFSSRTDLILTVIMYGIWEATLDLRMEIAIKILRRKL